MSEDAVSQDLVKCKVRVSHEDDWALAVLSLDGVFTGGKLVGPSPQFTGGIEGRDEITSQYQLSNWIAGVTSGALYTFRALKLPRRRVQLHQLAGSLRASGLQALANGTAVGVAKLSGRPSPALETAGWRIECEAMLPGVPGDGTAHEDGNLKSAASDKREDVRRVLVELAFQALAAGGVSDPDVLLRDGLVRDDAEALRGALESGADPNATDGEVLSRHAQSLIKPPVSDMFATAALERIFSAQPASNGSKQDAG